MMTLQQKKSKKFENDLNIFYWFKKEIDQYVKNGDITREQADLMIEDMADQLDF